MLHQIVSNWRIVEFNIYAKGVKVGVFSPVLLRATTDLVKHSMFQDGKLYIHCEMIMRFQQPIIMIVLFFIFGKRNVQ